LCSSFPPPAKSHARSIDSLALLDDQEGRTEGKVCLVI
jgi:hypothetical protein